MPNKVLPRRSFTPGSVPTPATHISEAGELLINWADKVAYTKNASGNLITVPLGGGGGSASIVSAATVAGFPATGSASNLYVATDARKIFGWDATNSVYVELGPTGGSGFSWATVPASATASGSSGDLAYDGNYVYVATGSSQWKRAALTTWSLFSPANVAGLQGWWDASDSSTLYDATSGGSLVAADGAVARWEDKSGNNRHATQSTSGSRPVRKTAVQGGKDVLRFDGSNDYLTSTNFLDLSSGQAITAFVACKRSTTGAYHAMIAKADGTTGANFLGWGFRLTDASKMDFYGAVSGNEAKAETSSTVAVSDCAVLVAKATAGSINTTTALYRNGSSLSVSRSGAASTLSASEYPVRIGAEFYQSTAYSLFNGDIAEICIYDAALSDTDRAAVESYLISKWGIV